MVWISIIELNTGEVELFLTVVHVCNYTSSYLVELVVDQICHKMGINILVLLVLWMDPSLMWGEHS